MIEFMDVLKMPGGFEINVANWLIGFIAAAVSAALFFSTFYFLRSNLSFALISVFFFLSTAIPDKRSKYRRLYSMGYRSEKLKKGMAVKEVIVGGEASLLTLMRMLNASYFYRFTVVDENFNKIGELNELELENLSAKFGAGESVGKVISDKLITSG